MTPATPFFPSRAHRGLWLPALLLLLLSFPLVRAAEDDAAFDPQRVEIRVHHGSDLPWNRAGFRIDVAHWRPNADLSIVAVGARGERIDLTPDPLTADAQGAMSLDVDYERTGLTPGRWTFVVGGEAGSHRVLIDLPEVEWPHGARPRFKMTYGAPGALRE